MKKASLITISFVLIIILLLIVGSVVFVLSPRSEISMSSTSRSQPSSNNSYAELLRFVERLMTYPGTPLGKPAAVLPGELPDDLLVSVPIPNGAEIIGSLVHVDGKYKQVQIILDVPEDPNEVMEFYRNSLKKAGWNESEVFDDSWGFSSVPPMPEIAVFCRYEREGPSLTVTANTSNGEKPADVQLFLDTNPQASVCRELFTGQSETTKDVLPLLKAPKGAVQKGGGGSTGGGSGGGGMRSLYTILETELSVKELETHYLNQLVEAGWELKEKGSNGTIAWSTWSFADEFGNRWSGFLLVSRLRQENLRYTELIVS